jgi:hypothetical protein
MPAAFANGPTAPINTSLHTSGEEIIDFAATRSLAKLNVDLRTGRRLSSPVHNSCLLSSSECRSLAQRRAWRLDAVGFANE